MTPGMPIFSPMMPYGTGLTPQPIQNTNSLSILEEQQRQQQQQQQQAQQTNPGKTLIFVCVCVCEKWGYLKHLFNESLCVEAENMDNHKNLSEFD